jgi:hypothetical protein
MLLDMRGLAGKAMSDLQQMTEIFDNMFGNLGNK